MDSAFLTNLLKFTIKKRYNVFKFIGFNIILSRDNQQVPADCRDFALLRLRYYHA